MSKTIYTLDIPGEGKICLVPMVGGPRIMVIVGRSRRYLHLTDGQFGELFEVFRDYLNDRKVGPQTAKAAKQTPGRS